MADLFARGVLEAILAHGRVVMNDYVFSVTEIEGGHRLHIIRGSEDQTLDVMDGPQGEVGPQGEKGDKGDKGDKGGYYYPHLRDDGRLAWTRSDATLPDIDISKSLIGPQGEAGPQGAKGDKGDKGGYYYPYLRDDGRLAWTRSDASMSDIGVSGSLIGPQGPKGETGETGPAGPAGLPGDKGEDGGYYIPSMGVNGILSWTGSKDGMPGYTSSVSLRGPAGVSPQVSLMMKKPTDGSRGFTRLTITDAQGTHSSDILDGLDGEDGGYYVPTLNADGSITWKGSKDDMPNIGTGSHSLQGPPGASGKDGGYYTPKVVYYEDKNAFSIIWTPSDGAMNPVPSQLIPLPGGAAEIDMATDEEVLAMLAELGALPVAADSDGAVIVDANGTIVM